MHPTVGRIVHYQSYGTPGGEYQPEPRAAIVTQVTGLATATGQFVSLLVLYPNGSSNKAKVPYAEEPTPGHWNWPPRTG